MKKVFLIIISLLALSITNIAQSIIITGKVMDSTGHIMAGATVNVLSNTKVGKSEKTDNNGRFQITAAPGSILIVSYIGYEPREMKVTASTEPLIIYLSVKATTNDEVIVEANTGYQKLKPNEMNGSVTVINNEVLNRQMGTNILDRLNGVTNGLLFNTGKRNGAGNEDNNISIRGLSTINGPVTPLIILDNFPYEGDINNINPNDVESITILKDASAASIWGAQAGNGVIVITSKKGKFNERLRVEVNSSIFRRATTPVQVQPEVSITQYLEFEAYLFNKGYYSPIINNLNTRPPLSPAVEILLRRKGGQISVADSLQAMQALALQDGRRDYEKYLQQTAVTQQHALSVRGGSAQFSWLLAGGYNLVENQNLSSAKKLNLHLDNNFMINKDLTINISAYYTSSQSQSGASDYLQTGYLNNRYVPYMALAGPNGEALPIPRYRKEFLDTLGQGRLLDWMDYPLRDHQEDYSFTDLQDIVARVGINYTILKGLSFTGNYQYERQTAHGGRHATINSYNTRNLINLYTTLSYSNAPDTLRIPMGDFLSRSGSVLQSQSWRAQLNFNRQFGRHGLNVLGGAEARQVANDPLGGFSVYGYQRDPLSQGIVDFVNPYKTILTGARQRIPGAAGLGQYSIYRFVSFFANGSYVYNKKYSISGSFRKDASNVFGATTNDKWNPLWSSGLGWNISEEAFYRVDWLPYLRFRLSYGYSGNLDKHKTPLAVSSTQPNPITNYPVQRIAGLNNPSLRWEKIRQTNFGLDFASPGRRISGSLEYYIKNGQDLYGSTFYDYTAWGRNGEITRNVAEMKGSGVDLTITARITEGALKWTSSLIYNFNQSKVTAYYTDKSKDFFGVGTGDKIIPIVGQPLYAVTAYKWAGLDASGDPQGYLNGVASKDYSAIINAIATQGVGSGSIDFLGTSVPKHFGGLQNSISFKGFDFSMNIVYQAGYYFRSPVYSSANIIGGGIVHADYNQRWLEPGDERNTIIPKFVYSDYPQFSFRDQFYQNSSINFHRGDHVRLQFINLSYNQKIGRSANIQLYGNLANIGILWRANKVGLDPDYPTAAAPPLQITAGFRCNF